MKSTEILDMIENTPVGKFFAIVFAIGFISVSVALTVAYYLTRR